MRVSLVTALLNVQSECFIRGGLLAKSTEFITMFVGFLTSGYEVALDISVRKQVHVFFGFAKFRPVLS